MRPRESGIRKVGYQTQMVAPSRMAVHKQFGSLVTPIGFRRAGAMLEAVATGQVDSAVLSWETSRDGGITTSYDALVAARGAHVTGHVLVSEREWVLSRFLVLGREAKGAVLDRPGRTIILAELSDRPGAIAELFHVLGERGANVVKADARPGAVAWSYRYLIEFDHFVTALGMRRLMTDLRSAAREVRVLGSYEIVVPAWRDRLKSAV